MSSEHWYSERDVATLIALTKGLKRVKKGMDRLNSQQSVIWDRIQDHEIRIINAEQFLGSVERGEVVFESEDETKEDYAAENNDEPPDDAALAAALSSSAYCDVAAHPLSSAVGSSAACGPDDDLISADEIRRLARSVGFSLAGVDLVEQDSKRPRREAESFYTIAAAHSPSSTFAPSRPFSALPRAHATSLSAVANPSFALSTSSSAEEFRRAIAVTTTISANSAYPLMPRSVLINDQSVNTVGPAAVGNQRRPLRAAAMTGNVKRKRADYEHAALASAISGASHSRAFATSTGKRGRADEERDDVEDDDDDDEKCTGKRSFFLHNCIALTICR